MLAWPFDTSPDPAGFGRVVPPLTTAFGVLGATEPLAILSSSHLV